MTNFGLLKKNFAKLVFCLICLFYRPSFSGAWGYWGWVLNQQTTITLDNFTGPNYITGFISLMAGFTMVNATISCIFDSVTPLYGPLTFNGGLLLLTRDLYLAGNCTIANAGVIAANGWSVTFPQKTAAFTLPGMTLGQINMILNSNVALSGTTTFTGACFIQGNGYAIDFTSGAFSVARGGSLAINNATLNNISANSISCIDNTATYTCYNTAWAFSSNYTFSQGNFYVVGDWAVAGPVIFTYTSPQALYIRSQASILFDQGMTFSYAPSNSSQLLLNFYDTTASMYFRNATFYVAGTGLQLLHGTLFFEGTCPVISKGTSAANGITLGDGSSASNNMNLAILAGSGPYITAGYLVNNNV